MPTLSEFASKLDMGGHRPLQIRYEKVVTGLNLSVRLLFLSDLHLRKANGDRVRQHVMRSIKSTCPHLILLGGDLVDAASGLHGLEGLLQDLSSWAPLYAVGGNHDRMVGWDKVKSAITRAGGHWLNGTHSIWNQSNESPLILEGPGCPAHGQTGYRVLLAHTPASFPRAANAGVNLMLSGHLHGCQIVTHQVNGRLYPGAWLYKWNGLRFSQGNSTLVVGRGVHDTVPLRWNCPREAVLCHLR